MREWAPEIQSSICGVVVPGHVMGLKPRVGNGKACTRLGLRLLPCRLATVDFRRAPAELY